MQFALVNLTISECLLVVDQIVSQALNVLKIKHVFEKNVLTLVREHAVLMQDVKF